MKASERWIEMQNHRQLWSSKKRSRKVQGCTGESEVRLSKERKAKKNKPQNRYKLCSINSSTKSLIQFCTLAPHIHGSVLIILPCILIMCIAMAQLSSSIHLFNAHDQTLLIRILGQTEHKNYCTSLLCSYKSCKRNSH